MMQTAKFAVLPSQPAFRPLIFTIAVLFAPVATAQSTPQLRNHFPYKCSGERIVITRCRHDSDMPGYPPTTPQQDYCAVVYPDRPLHNGFTVETVELRGDVIRKLQACGALPGTPTDSTPPSTSDPSSALPSQSADAYLKQAEPYFNGKDAAKAIDPLKKAIALSPSATAYNELGIAYMNLNQYPDSAAAFQQAVRLDPNDANVRLNLGDTYLKMQKFTDAAASLSEAYRLNPKSAAIANAYGIALEYTKDYAHAAAAYKLSTQLDPKFVAGYSDFGELCLYAGDNTDALETYRQLQKIDQDAANDLYSDITQADLQRKKPSSAADRAKAYANLDTTTLLVKANKGDDAAMKQLSDLYYAKKDNTNGLAWEIKAAAAGDVEIENDLGRKYENGSAGATKSVDDARAWYQKAGVRGDDTAQLNLCKSYAAELNLDEGLVAGAGKDDLQSPIPPLPGTKADVDAAFVWCVAGGDQGLYLAAWYAGVLNARGGQDHTPDFAESYFWLLNGNLQAGAVFKQKVGKHLTAAQRSEIEKRAAAFRPSPMELLHDQLTKPTAQKN